MTTAYSMAISIHALREEGDNSTHFLVRCSHLFLSTPSARRATWRNWPMVVGIDISIHALREEGDLIFAVYVHFFFISIHALREEGDG